MTPEQFWKDRRNCWLVSAACCFLTCVIWIAIITDIAEGSNDRYGLEQTGIMFFVMGGLLGITFCLRQALDAHLKIK